VTQLAAGAITFVFTDLEGSTRLVRELRERYADVLDEYQRIVRAVFTSHGAEEIDTQGDAFFFAFARARDAVVAAFEAQRALDSHEWPHGAEVRARIGIHTGQAARAGERYLGLAVHRAARICAAGHGGQVLVSETTRSLLEAEEEELVGVTLRDLGEQRLKDIERPVRLYTLSGPGLRDDFPALRTAETPFAGREEELAHAAEATVRAPRFRFPPRLLVAAVAVAVVAVVPIVALLVRDEDGSPERPAIARVALDSVAIIDPETNELDAQVRVGNSPIAVSTGADNVWVANAGDGTISRINPQTRRVERTIPAPVGGGIAASSMRVWVARVDESACRFGVCPTALTLSQVDPRDDTVVDRMRLTGSRSSTVPPRLPGIALHGESLWAVDAGSKLFQVDGATGRVRATIRTPTNDAVDVAVGDDAVWVLYGSSTTFSVARVDISSGIISSSTTIGSDARAIAVGEGGVWVAAGVDVVRIDPAASSVTARIDVGGTVSDVAVGEGAVWAADSDTNRVVRIDPESNRVTARIPLGNRPAAIAAGEGAVWVTVY
jgi:YVTN family beta-propeller protein